MSAKPETVSAAAPAADQVTIVVDGKKIQVRKGAMLIQATDAAGVYIPRFCYHKKLSIAASCRMCLVEVEKAPKPMPACATPVADGMIVRTRSDKARAAQQGVMEFLLINHPLDCPVCDQGGECQLQDLALGYGKDVARFTEPKRAVVDKDIGPLIATEMTRCIHCTRCVRFGKEIAGVMEFGGLGRGDRTEIRTFLDGSVNSELSGNVIDLCPVGALTSKPYRYSARPWELRGRASVAPHDCVGSNLTVQTRNGRVLRVLPRENEAVNECWLSDRDRFSYEALNSEERLRAPMIRVNGMWEETDWNTAIEFTAQGLKQALKTHGPDGVGALAAPGATLEEFYLLQKLVRALGSGNVDHRLRQSDFSDDAAMPPFPWLGQALADLEQLAAVLLVGADPRREAPLLNLRLRKAALRGACVMAVNAVDYDFNYKIAHKTVTDPLKLLERLAGVAKALGALKGAELPAPFTAQYRDVAPTETDQAMARALAERRPAAVLLGALATSHPLSASVRALAQLVAETAGARFGFIPEADSAAGWLAGCVPHRGPAGKPAAPAGRNAAAMLREPRQAYLLLGVEPELDGISGARALAAMQAAQFVAMLTTFKPSPFRTRAVEYADVLLPLAPFTETAGTFVNAEGRRQEFNGAVAPLGQARPGWKILRVLGNLLGLSGFEQADIEDVRREIDTGAVAPTARLGAWQLSAVPPAGLAAPSGQVLRIAEVPMYAVDAITRRAASLQKTAANPEPAACLNAAQAERLKLKDGDGVLVRMIEGDARLKVVVDARVPDGCVLIPAGCPETATLGGHGPATIVGEGA
ncbi:MAG: NADH-quinone oxidoreductase subunit G [Candidatus Muproteobacteria bacterium RIFCSPHIGHO2_01_FULL_65_16]|uniref:NADH-quinone oxidoreductase n=1 Tax=Candidatus Muproteobacteria bacterium RIFCSPHIGHO2_01_FULL_65_16 TaxID=1817764 RepID=A0A1F6TR26_9PROT|nr:MAG: NADH-quinone oxidoreductase subunit G [Candidatus Muproteobacteria bacterium RIFCSPHIGHO2_01_FULL_65_16]